MNAKANNHDPASVVTDEECLHSREQCPGRGAVKFGTFLTLIGLIVIVIGAVGNSLQQGQSDLKATVVSVDLRSTTALKETEVLKNELAIRSATLTRIEDKLDVAIAALHRLEGQQQGVRP